MKLKGILILAMGFFIITAIILGIVLLVNQGNDAIDTEVTIDIFEPAYYVDADFTYFTVEGNKFSGDSVWFYTYLNNLGLEETEQGYHEHYTLSLTLTDEDGKIYLDFLNTEIYDREDYFETALDYESVRFDLDTTSLSNDMYYVNLKVNDLISGTMDSYDNYFVIER